MKEHMKKACLYLVFFMGVIGWSVLAYASYTQAPIVISAPISPLLLAAKH